jgi:hypothetical protein
MVTPLNASRSGSEIGRSYKYAQCVGSDAQNSRQFESRSETAQRLDLSRGMEAGVWRSYLHPRSPTACPNDVKDKRSAPHHEGVVGEWRYTHY